MPDKGQRHAKMETEAKMETKDTTKSATEAADF
jgi:hypothetical protein